MRELFVKLRFLFDFKPFLISLFVINFLGTIYGYIWYIPQLQHTELKYYLFVPDSPTASLFFSIAMIGWLLGRHFKLMEALAVVTLVKYGVWAVVMNLLTLAEKGFLPADAWMLVISHSLMAVQAILYGYKYRFTYIHVAIAAIWTLHNDAIDYLFDQMPYYGVVMKYSSEIGYFTFWLSIVCIAIAFFYAKRERKIATLQSTL